MRNNSVALWIGVMVMMMAMGMAVMAGCASKQESPREDNNAAKEAIEEYIAGHWEEYGYSEKPAKYIALSFDDGPCAPSHNGGTKALLKVLETARVKATFFVIGQNVRNNRAVAQAIVDAGHELGNHSDGYDSLGGKTVDVITASLGAASWVISEISGKDPVLFRAPNLSHGTNLSLVCKNRDMALIDGVAHNDWDGTGHKPVSIKNSVLNSAQDGGIIILHDNNTSKGNTMKALPEIISGLREQGFWIMTVSELAMVKGITLEAGVRYSAMHANYPGEK